MMQSSPTRWLWVGAVIALTGTLGQAEEPKKDTVVIKPIKYAELEGLIKKQKGKVFVLDFWFRGCTSCEAAMPHLAEMGHNLAKDGLVVMTMDIDPPEARPKAVDWLKKNKIALTNMIIAEGESEDLWYEKLDLGAFPTTMIYDREGKLVKRFEGAEPKEIEKLVRELLKK